jgi:hypothetical protein
MGVLLRTRIVAPTLAVVTVFLAGAPALAGLESITDRDAAAGLKAALEKGSQAAVARLGRKNGFFGDPRVKIALPDSLAKAEKVMRRVGQGRRADELVLTMNRAAETAVAEAKPVLVGAVKKMTVSDAKAILTGGDTAATDYFRRTTSAPLHAKFLPVVKRATAKVGLAQKYNAYAQKGVRYGLVKEDQADLDDYVARKALDGLFLVLADEEKKIRADPVGAASRIIGKVFGALK